MRAREIFETPLPDDWDKKAFEPKTTFKSRMAYAIERAKKLGKGSSRTAFTIEYQGRETVLKVAHTKKGMAQNEAEAKILKSPEVVSLGITIPMIDHDVNYTWIHTEKAGVIGQKQLCQILKTPDMDEFVAYAVYSNAGISVEHIKKSIKSKFSDDDFKIFESYIERIVKLHKLTGMIVGDLYTAANWGMYNGHPVVIDVGLTDDVYNNHY